jgi:proteic killer suppression protein
VEIESIKHKALRNLVEKGRRKGVIEPDRIIDMIAFLDAAATLDELSIPPNFGFHALTGNRAGEYAMTVTKNWRLTFSVNEDGALIDLNLEDYH